MTDEKISPLSRKIDSATTLRAALKELNKDRVIGRYQYRLLKGDFGAISDDTFQLWRDELRLYTTYWVQIHVSNKSTPAEQDKTLHLSLHGDQALVVFAETIEKQKRDIFTRMRYGKYLTKYHPDIENEDVKRLVAEFEYKHGAPPELKIGETEEDFVRAIKDGPSDSCQADKFYSGGEGFRFEGHKHPAICYASGDIQVAWIENSAGEVTARALINKAKKYHSRPYGDTERIDRLLEAQGFKKRTGALVGCRLKVIENQNSDGWLMPYVDAGIASGGGSLRAVRSGNYWCLTDDNSSEGVDTYCGYEKNGTTTTDEDEDEDQEPEYGHCERCGDDLNCHYDYVYSDWHGETYCMSCSDRYWVYAIMGVRARQSYNFDYIRQDECTYIDCLNEHARDEIIDELDIVKDEYRGEWIHLEDAVERVYDEERYHVDDCVEAGSNPDGTIYLHKKDLKDSSLVGKIYYDGAGNPFWYKSDEIQGWVESGTDQDRYALEATVDAGQEELPLKTYPEEKIEPKTCPEEKTEPKIWQEVYRWIQSRGVKFEYGDGCGTWFVNTSGDLNFDEVAEPSHYRIKPDQPDVVNWRGAFLKAQELGVEFEVKIFEEDRWVADNFVFSGEKMAKYRIQEVAPAAENNQEREGGVTT